ncbi:hypothetical protein SODALDRAFT_361537 [Sodiomyces alkalinus F11]|uniref:Uncharacterized protein n=1 Tax=Sodiomyces alkalinus (strain CBS 110278 / VKM F-3762 / F11) TaxID=1314773 RepID=A0A3N2PQT0_SODAK|nr:hypothetical protein SODALDRAFT_361537 [Sodiomyces alkalinus F11]ROT36716.1 hypothetical protein SODALDRAFT_361537 [Sodiomyces alkalinus F11]
MATAEKVTNDDTVHRHSVLVNLIKTCRDLAKDLGALASSLDSAPLTLSALAKECRTVTSVLKTVLSSSARPTPWRSGTPYRQGTPAGLARPKAHMQLSNFQDD